MSRTTRFSAVPPKADNQSPVDDGDQQKKLESFLGGADTARRGGDGAPAVVDKPAEKTIRNGYSMPESDYGLIEEAQFRAFKARVRLNESQILRVALRHLSTVPDEQFVALAEAVVADSGRGRRR